MKSTNSLCHNTAQQIQKGHWQTTCNYHPWLPQYRVTPPPKYHSNTDPRKFLMCYVTTIALAGGDDATLTKSLIISLEDATVN
jgi:hypothetical protein